MFSAAPRNLFARQRIGRFLRHRYTRLPVVDIFDSGQSPANPNNLAANWSAETNLDGYAAPNSSIERALGVAHLGAASIRVTTSDMTQSGITYGLTGDPNQQLLVEPGQPYTASLYARLAAPGDIGFQLGIEWYSVAFVRLSPDATTPIFLESTETETDWEQFSVTGIAPVSAVYAGIHLYTTSPQGVFQFYTDDWQLEVGTTATQLEGLDQYNDPVMTFGDPVPNQSCLYMTSNNQAGITLQRREEGTLSVNRPTLFVQFNDPLKVGDEVLEVRDSDGYIFLQRAVVEEISEIAPAGPRVYQAYAVREVDTPNPVPR